MSNITKHALAESLKKLLLKKPLNKITINDLTTDCGISRMAFYYHFKDIYDLVEWVCLEESRGALQGKKTYATWQEGLLQIFEAVYENKPFIINAYNAISREQIENFLFQLTHDLIMSVVEEQARSTSLTQEQKSFIADFYKYSFCRHHARLDPTGNEIRLYRHLEKHVHHNPWKHHKFYSKLYKTCQMISFYSFHIFCKLNSNANGNTIRDRKGKLHIITNK